MLDTTYLDSNRAGWRVEDINTLVAWTHESATVPNTTRVTDVTLMADLSVAECDEVFTTLDTAAQGSKTVSRAVEQLKGAGLDLSHANAQAMIGTLFAANTTLRDKLLAMGRRTVDHWEAMGARQMDDPSRAYWLDQARA